MPISTKLDKYSEKIKQSHFHIREMTKSDLDVAIEWAHKEGWNPGLNDAEAFYDADPHGFFIGEIKGEPVAVISAVKYNDQFGFIGFNIVKKEFRGSGFGLAMFDKAMSYLDGVNIGADGVYAQLDNYKTLGFDIAHKNLRYEGIARVGKSEGTVDLSKVPFEKLLEYDAKMFPAPRKAFLEKWVNLSRRSAVGYMDGEELKGYGVIRKCTLGYKIGPLFADTPEIAEKIYYSLTRIVVGETIFLDVPEPNQAAIALAEKNNMSVSFKTARIYTQQPPKLPLENIFGITSFELG